MATSSRFSASLMCSYNYNCKQPLHSSPAFSSLNFSSLNPPKTPLSLSSLFSRNEPARQGIWSMRQDLQLDLDLPSNACAYAVSNNSKPKEKGPPPMVFERFQGVIDQLFHHVRLSVSLSAFPFSLPLPSTFSKY